MSTITKSLQDLLTEGEPWNAEQPWDLRGIQSEQCLSYVAWNRSTREAIVVDPKDTDLEAYRTLSIGELKDYTWLAVIDTHTHADHISCAADLASELKAPLVMHEGAPSKRVDLRVARTTRIPSIASAIELLVTPGHTQDSLTPVWGPFIFGGDTVLFGDTGRDDLPGGNAADHFESIQLIKKFATPQSILLPGHDHKGGRASTWATQLKVNSSLTQPRDQFIQESEAFDAPAPELLKKSLKENFK